MLGGAGTPVKRINLMSRGAGMMPAMQEIELKYQVPLERRAAVLAWVNKGSTRRQRLQAAYFDTPERTLARAGLALRLRLEGRRWVQTLKGDGEDGMTRLEHNVALDARGATLPALDPARHAGHPAGARLLALLDAAGAAPLHCLYRTDIVRLARTLRVGASRVEIAYDTGHLLAGQAGEPGHELRQEPVCELEFELLEGEPAALLDAVRRHALRLGLWLDLRTKAERGDLLARGLAMAPPEPGTAAALRRGMSTAAGLHAVLLACLGPLLRNSSQIAADLSEPEHLHQLRVALRRLRCALALFDGLPGLAALQPELEILATEAEAWFDRLGVLRDAGVQAALYADELAQAWHACALPERSLPAPAAAEHGELGELMRDRGVQTVQLGLIALLARLAELQAQAEAAKPPRLRPLLRARLQRWLKALRAPCAEFATLDQGARHRLRRRIKRLRYALEFSAPLLDADGLAALLRALARAQQALGEQQDLALAIALRREMDLGETPRRAFELGWLSARQQQQQAPTARRVRQLARALESASI